MAGWAVRVRLVAVGDGVFTVVGGIGEDDGADGAKVLSVLYLETAEETSVADQGDLALGLNTELSESFKVLNGTATILASQYTCPLDMPDPKLLTRHKSTQH